MTKKPPAITDAMKPNHAVVLDQYPDETGAHALARRLLEPQVRHAVSASAYAGKALGGSIEAPGLMDYVDHVQKIAVQAEAGNLAIASRLLASQAVTLDTIFT